MKLMITGHRGFVGSALMDMALSNPEIETIGIEKEATVAEWECQVLEALKGQDITAVVHCGAISDNQYKGIDIFAWNVYTTKFLAAYCAYFGIHLVYFSSQTARSPQTLYGHTKKLAEIMVREAPGLKACILQPFNIWGPGEGRKSPDCRSLAYRLADHELKVLWDTVRDYVHVSDVVSAVGRALESKATGTFQVGTGVAVPSVILTENVGYDGYVCEDRPPYIEPFTCANPQKFLPGWQPTVFVEKGIVDLEQRLQS